MRLASHEAHDLQELTLSCVNTITNMALFLNQAKDAELKTIIQKHFAAHIQDYNIKVEYLSNPNGTTTKLQIPQLPNNLQSYTRSTTATNPIKPRTDVKEFNDREIATAYLLTLKRAGREYAWSAMEASNPGIRAFLEDAFTMASHHAFEIWQWMVQQGYYPLQSASPAILNTFGQLYETVQTPPSMMQ